MYRIGFLYPSVRGCDWNVSWRPPARPLPCCARNWVTPKRLLPHTSPSGLRARPAVTPLVDTINTRGREPPHRQEITRRAKKRQQKYSTKGLNKSGHIEGLLFSRTTQIHIPSDLVVGYWTSAVESSSPLDFLSLHAMWTPFGRLISYRIASIISMGCDFTTKSGGICSSFFVVHTTITLQSV